jgi:hypothetical protein
MSDWIGLVFFMALIAAAFFGLKKLARPVRRKTGDYERNIANSTSMLGASMSALQELLNPEEAKSRIVQTELKVGRYDKKKRDGKASGAESAD